MRGIVQGVGFRPFVYSLATRYNLTGWVRNSSNGVEIEINGSDEGVSGFEHDLRTSPPPLARIDRLESEACVQAGYTSFEIEASQPRPGEFIPISPDVTTCPDCQRELFDPADRRFRYPFINCTNCGPRFTIIRDIPYDRPNTTMAGFALCPDCASEYKNPLDRRFHAQPVACPVCGPSIWFEANGERLAEKENALQTAREWLRVGKILAIKGLGGFHLACDAANPKAVSELRVRKQRSDKAFALMAFNLAALEKHCYVTPQERELIESRQRPVVLLESRPDTTIAPQAAPGQHTLGFMLAYTPLHLLLLEPAPGFPDVLVMTSGNLSEEPIAYDDEDALARLAGLADGFLMHDRAIHTRIDDSVARVVESGPYMIRRARGYAPDPLMLPADLPPLLAAGAELKNTFCLTRDRYAFISHHIGDLENYETLRSFEEGVSHYERMFRVKPELLACDLHPDYLASRYARSRAQEESLPLVEVQHHHAHLAACLAENGWSSDDPVIGFSFDGTGYGTDGAIWGSEVLYGGYRGYQRVAHLAYVPLPGGDLAVRNPGRATLAHLAAAGIEWEADLPPVKAICSEERSAIRTQIRMQLNAPLTSSMGRFFDAVSALLGVRQTSTYEGQAAIELEALADPDEQHDYPLEIHQGLIDPSALWQKLLTDWRAGTSLPALAARVHNSVARMVVDASRSIQRETGCSTVALSGGVWQNCFLVERAHKGLTDAGFKVLLHRRLPANDGCIALGQAIIAARMEK